MVDPPLFDHGWNCHRRHPLLTPIKGESSTRRVSAFVASTDVDASSEVAVNAEFDKDDLTVEDLTVGASEVEGPRLLIP
ncbi:hypothetical protein HBA54_22685 [Pelagibius litoralis]|uniref:Uncharacterized protein n=1 Tax=Pelagibius litoralis TaxID=374515 RepID=A0A967F1W7_9PROT|nr:hypothetical protein [Pelagibius litoralis]NIA71406.1 hypothetical protein [Pelagibius litoralis]